ncbi:flagellar hook-length control protein FliK [Aliikangiella sp. IMCC44632]
MLNLLSPLWSTQSSQQEGASNASDANFFFKINGKESLLDLTYSSHDRPESFTSVLNFLKNEGDLADKNTPTLDLSANDSPHFAAKSGNQLPLDLEPLPIVNNFEVSFTKNKKQKDDLIVIDLPKDPVEEMVAKSASMLDSLDSALHSASIEIKSTDSNASNPLLGGALLASKADKVNAGQVSQGQESPGQVKADQAALQKAEQLSALMPEKSGAAEVELGREGVATLSKNAGKDLAAIQNALHGSDDAANEAKLNHKLGLAQANASKLERQEFFNQLQMSPSATKLDNQLGSLNAVASLLNETQSKTQSNARSNLSALESVEGIRALSNVEHSDTKAGLKTSVQPEMPQQLQLKGNIPANLAMRIQWMFKQAMSSAEIMLDPPELGPMNVKIQQTNGETNIVFQVNNQAAKDALSEHMEKLKEMLADSGINLGEASVNQRGAGEQKDDSSDNKEQAGMLAENQTGDQQTITQEINHNLVDVYS